MQGRRDAQIDVGMRLRETAEAIHQPFRREIGRGADREHARALPLNDARGAERDAIEGVAQDRKIIAPCLRDDELLALAVEELEAERLFERLDLMAHRALRDAKLAGGLREALMARRCLKGLEGVQWRQTTQHRTIS
jgi:hypothetical protein